MSKKYIFLIAGIALFLGILPMPYGYYQLLRWFVCGMGIYGAYLSTEKKMTFWAWTLGVIALIFNPFFKFHFAVEFWKAIDLTVGILFCLFFRKIKNEK